jgi:hypothetical protein
MWALKEIKTNNKSRKNNSSWDNKESFYIYTLVHRTNWYHWLERLISLIKEFYWETISMLRKSHALAKGTDYRLSTFVIYCIMYVYPQ